MSRTTIDLDDSVLEQLRSRAKLEGKSMGQLASERLAVALHEERASDSASDSWQLSWPARSMGKPSIDLHDKDAVWKVLEGGQNKTGGRE